MARPIGKLTALGITQARRRGYYSDGGGLYLQVSASGAKSWVFRFKEAGRLREMGLGPLHTIGLAEARRRAQEHRVARLDGRDPIEARRPIVARSGRPGVVLEVAPPAEVRPRGGLFDHRSHPPDDP